MSALIALDVALLPPPDIARRAAALSAALAAGDQSQGLRLDDQHVPHITLVQQFVALSDIDAVYARVEAIARQAPAMRLRVTGAGRGSSTLWMTVERTAALLQLHDHLMHELRRFEHLEGGPEAFFADEARPKDVQWVAKFRTEASGNRFLPHITLGHGTRPPAIEPTAFDAATLAACHLGRFCTCRRVLRTWTLAGSESSRAGE